MKDFQKVNTRQRVSKMHARGLTPTEIAKVLDISRQRVHQHLNALGLPNPPATAPGPAQNGSEQSSEVQS